MMLVDCYLGKKITSSDEKTGNVIEEIKWSKDPIYCEYRSISNKEFYQAQSTGYKPEMTLKISSFDYLGEAYVKYDDVEYTILKINHLYDNPDEILLTLVKGIKNGST